MHLASAGTHVYRQTRAHPSPATHTRTPFSHTQASNVLLRSNASEARGVTAKVADFGLTFKMDQAETHVSAAFQGTLSHMAPEVLTHGRQSKAADV